MQVPHLSIKNVSRKQDNRHFLLFFGTAAQFEVLQGVMMEQSGAATDEELTHPQLLSQVTSSFHCALLLTDSMKSDHGCSQNDGKRPIINRICCYHQ